MFGADKNKKLKWREYLHHFTTNVSDVYGHYRNDKNKKKVEG